MFRRDFFKKILSKLVKFLEFFFHNLLKKKNKQKNEYWNKILPITSTIDQKQHVPGVTENVLEAKSWESWK